MTSTQLQAKYAQANEGEALDIFGSTVRPIMRSKDTGGGFSLWHNTFPAGTGIPPHIHEREDETFHILSGEFDFVLEDRKVRATAGDTVYGPKGGMHGFVNAGSSDGAILILATPGGMDEFFEQLAMAKGMEEAVAVSAEFGIEFLLGE